MNESYKNFIETWESPNTKKVIKSYQAIGNYDYSNCAVEDVENIILNMKPKSPMEVIRICSTLTQYAKYLNNEQLIQISENLDRKKLWTKAKPDAPRKYLSHSQFKRVCHDIEMFEEFNTTFHQALFRCVYEGIYNDDMSVIKNLRASDIKGNIVTLHEDNGNSYNLEISPKLVEDLEELRKINVWERRNRFGTVEIQATGVYPDSCFKVELRKDSSEYAYRFAYYRVIRKIAKEYVEYSLSPTDIFVSGLMHRIGLKLKEHNISIEEAFAPYNRDEIANKIIDDELKRCHHITDFSFKQLVKGHLDVFMT